MWRRSSTEAADWLGERLADDDETLTIAQELVWTAALIAPATNHFVVRSLIALILYARVLVPGRLARVAAGLLAAPRVLSSPTLARP
jgi:hypothetical protein